MHEYLNGNSKEAPWQLKLYYELQATGWQHLPYAGGILDQPYRLMEYLRVVREELARFEEKRAQMAEAKKLLEKLTAK